MKIIDIKEFKENLKSLKKRDEDIYCANCGVRTGAITRESILGGKCLCTGCQNAIPTLYRKRLSDISIYEYTELRKYLSEESLKLSKIFKKSHNFSYLQLDVDNGILRYQYKKTPAIYISVDNISDFDLSFYGEPETPEAPEAREKAGKVGIELAIIEPRIFVCDILDDFCYEKTMLDFYKNYQFSTYQSNARRRTGESRTKDYESSSESVPESPSPSNPELQKAMSLFMFDSLSEVTQENLKKQRNRLIKSFHPDTNSDEDNKYAQKINEAYSLLFGYINKEG